MNYDDDYDDNDDDDYNDDYKKEYLEHHQLLENHQQPFSVQMIMDNDK